MVSLRELSAAAAMSMIAACAFVQSANPPVQTEISAIPATKVPRPVIPDNEAGCVAAGGAWSSIGLPGMPKRCDMKSADGGTRCIDSKQCQGWCLAPKGSAVGAVVAGSCSIYLLEFGNLLEVSNGRVVTLNVE